MFPAACGPKGCPTQGKGPECQKDWKSGEEINNKKSEEVTILNDNRLIDR
jgi:hypothetical protein